MLHNRLREMREALGIKQVYMARQLHMSPSGYHGLESGRRKISAEMLNKIARVLGVDVSLFFP